MSNFVLNVVRAEDLLVARFEFVNLVLDPDESSMPRRLIRVSPDEPSLVIVHFPPQHIAEEAFENVDFSVNEVRSLISGESRLAFELTPDVEALPLTMDSLLDWDRLEPVLVSGEPPEDPDAPPISMPLPHETAIELPFRLTLSPLMQRRWTHHSRPFGRDGLVELWHTRLTPPPGASPQLQPIAIWSPDLPDFNPVQNPFTMSLTDKQRSEIVQISQFRLDESQQEELERLFHENPELFERAQRWLSSLSQRLLGDQLMLSALGGWLRVHSQFNFPPIPTFLMDDEELLGHPIDPATGGVDLFALSDWSHVISMGRDQYARTAERGFLFPFGHRADLITITERRFLSNGILAELEAFLVQRSFLIIQEPERRYENPGLPFVSMTITIPATPDLGIRTASEHFVPRVNNAPFPFPVRATDHRGSSIDLAIPMVWVPVNEIGALGQVANEYQALSRVDFFNETVAFAPDDEQTREGPAGRADRLGRTTMKTVAMEFEHGSFGGVPGGPPFQPLMKHADVRLPAVDQLGLAVAGPSKIKLHPDYVSQGLAGAREQVFAEIVGGLPLQLPAQQAGGLLALGPPPGLPPGVPVPPGLKLDGLSLTHGAVPNVAGLVNGFSAAQALEGLGGRLLGVIDLKDVIESVTDKEELPKLKAKAVPGGHEISFTWGPKVKKDDLPDPLEALSAGGDPALSITGKLFRPSGLRSALDGASAEVEGTLSNLALSFVDVLTVGFSKLHFQTKTGEKPEFSADIKSFEFFGDLKFVNKLAELLRDPRASGSTPGGPDVAVTPEGISAALTLAIPSFSLGVFSLRNLSFSSKLNLYFSNQPAAIRFALSSRQDPFLVSYSVFGGGGHFALSANTDDASVDVEASLEFGASVSVDLIVAKGTAQVMAGVVFSMKEQQVLLGGYLRIHGCLEILKIVSVSVDFHLSLIYQAPNATGRASLTVMVRVLAFSKSVTLTVERSINMETGATRNFAQAISPQDWREYCDAFA